MASTLDITINTENDHYLIEGGLRPGGTLPQEIFIYTNTGNTSLGEFYGTCNLQELGRLQIFQPGSAIPIFGNKYVRYGQIKIKVKLSDDPNSVVTALVSNVKSLSTAYSQQTEISASYTIP